jgi:hypothetical protein
MHERKVLSGFCVHDLELLAFANESGNIIEIHVAASGGIVQPAVPILLDDDGGWFHLGLLYVAVHKGQIHIDTIINTFV